LWSGFEKIFATLAPKKEGYADAALRAAWHKKAPKRLSGA